MLVNGIFLNYSMLLNPISNLSKSSLAVVLLGHRVDDVNYTQYTTCSLINN